MEIEYLMFSFAPQTCKAKFSGKSRDQSHQAFLLLPTPSLRLSEGNGHWGPCIPRDCALITMYASVTHPTQTAHPTVNIPGL